ncbi:hypothetical protein NKDENANG_01758 [Candidatus Entotheonellaceae bacterium PAL068K]
MKLGDWILFGCVLLGLLVLISDAVFNIISALSRGTLY